MVESHGVILLVQEMLDRRSDGDLTLNSPRVNVSIVEVLTQDRIIRAFQRQLHLGRLCTFLRLSELGVEVAMRREVRLVSGYAAYNDAHNGFHGFISRAIDTENVHLIRLPCHQRYKPGRSTVLVQGVKLGTFGGGVEERPKHVL